MKRVPQIRVLRIHLMVTLVALPLLTLSTPEFLSVQRASAQTEALRPVGAPQRPQRTIEIDYHNRRYEPPARTLKIPPDFKKQDARFAVRAGDTIKICNKDPLYTNPFSVSKGNIFNMKLSPGSCQTYMVNNEGEQPIFLRLADEIHTRNKLWLVVLPRNAPYEGEEDTPPPPKQEADLYSNETPPIKINLEGTWICMKRCPAGGGQEGKSAHISQDGRLLTFINEGHHISEGHFEDESTVVATDWGNLKATITNKGRTLNWANGTVWEKQ